MGSRSNLSREIARLNVVRLILIGIAVILAGSLVLTMVLPVSTQGEGEAFTTTEGTLGTTAQTAPDDGEQPKGIPEETGTSEVTQAQEPSAYWAGPNETEPRSTKATTETSAPAAETSAPAAEQIPPTTTEETTAPATAEAETEPSAADDGSTPTGTDGTTAATAPQDEEPGAQSVDNFSAMADIPGTGREAEPAEEGFDLSCLVIQIVLAVCLVADLAAIVLVTLRIGSLKKALAAQNAAAANAPRPSAPAPGFVPEEVRRTVPVNMPRRTAETGTTGLAAAVPVPGGISVGKVHNIGARRAQQDSFGMTPVGSAGMLAVVADGMGGLSGGDQVSQKIVISMLTQASQLSANSFDGVLNRMLVKINDEVNQMLGPNGLYKSGSTLISVLIQGKQMHWISVGDSRIYLYRAGNLIQLNHEHTYEQELMKRAMDGEISFEAVQADPQKSRLTSFIGMGKLKHVDASLQSITLTQGDRILLMSDGVFNTLPEQTISAILTQNTDVQQAARQMEAQILAAQAPGQDNFTAVILGV